LMIAFPIHYLLHRHSSKATDAYWCPHIDDMIAFNWTGKEWT
jgi:hypothetical protein